MSDLTSILKMLFGNLTRSGVDYGNAAPPSDQPGMISEHDGGSNHRFFHDPSEAGVALAQGMHPAAQVSTANLPDQLDSTADPTFSSPQTPMLPHVFRPPFQQAATDEAGNIRGRAPGLTKGGTLLKILLGGLHGGVDAIAGGALDAPRNGESPFGTGVQAAMQMPWLRARRQQALQQQQQENQIRQDEISSLPARRAQRNAQAAATLDSTQAEAGLRRAQTTKALQGPASKDSLQEQRQSFAEDHADMFQDNAEKKNFVLYGMQPKAATKNPNEWQLRIDAANGDEDSQTALDQRFSERKTLTKMRHTSNRPSNKESEAQDAADAEAIASKIMNSSNGDPDKALTLFDQHSPSVTDPKQRKLGPLIRKALRGRKQINKPVSELDRLLAQP
jgi:predicted lipid-binding transport protein (Tim44 family)